MFRPAVVRESDLLNSHQFSEIGLFIYMLTLIKCFCTKQLKSWMYMMSSIIVNETSCC